MAQSSVDDYFATRKRRTSEELQNKQKVLILDDNEKRKALPIISEDNQIMKNSNKLKMESKKESVVRNLFDKPVKTTSSRTRTPRSRRVPAVEDKNQPDIREVMLKFNKEIEENKNVAFEKLGSLSPKKTPRCRKITRALKIDEAVELQNHEPDICKTPTKGSPTKEISTDEIKTRITKSSRLAELRAKINNLRKCEGQLGELDLQLKVKKDESKKNMLKLKECERINIELEIPLSPQKSLLSPQKFTSPIKSILLSPKASPAKRLLYEPKEESATPICASPVKAPAYQRYQGLVDEGKPGMPLPYKYRLLIKMFDSLDCVVAILFKRKKLITFSEIKGAVQQQIGRDFTLDHLAQIKTIYPDAFHFKQEKVRDYGALKAEKYELVITPVLNCDTGRLDLLERFKKFYNAILEIAKDCHIKFLQSLNKPLHVDKNKITNWHMEFDPDSCKEIPKAELPQPPAEEKNMSAKNILEKANKMCIDNSRIKKAIELLAQQRVKEKANCSLAAVSPTTNPDIQNTTNKMQNVEVSIVDTPPATPKLSKTNSLFNPAFNSLLEKIRAKQEAKALEMMTRSTSADKEALMYSRLPEMAKIIRSIFVSEKKSVLALEFVIKKLDDSYRLKLKTSELEEHIRLLCRLSREWATIFFLAGKDHLKLDKEYDLTKVTKKLEALANAKA